SMHNPISDAAVCERMRIRRELGRHRPENIGKKALESGADLPAHVCVPLCGENEILGSLHLVRQERAKFTRDELDMLQVVGEQAGLALQRAMLMEHLETLVEERSAALRDSERWLRGIFQTQADAVFVTDA